MLTQKYRPTSFSEVKGSEFSVKVLRGVAKNPDRAPRSLIFYGPPGSGKTTCARILPKALNCEKNVTDCCNRCESCRTISESSGNYMEYNCAHAGGVAGVRDLQDSLHYSFATGYRVVCFDEIHLISEEAQGALLNAIETAPPDLFFVFCTTNPEDVLTTLKSRSIELEFSQLPDESLKNLLRGISEREGFTFSSDIFDRIARNASGDIRSATNQLEEAMLIGEEEFLSSFTTLDSIIIELINSVSDEETLDEEYSETVDKLMCNPVHFIRRDFSRVIVELSNEVFVKKNVKEMEKERVIWAWFKLQQFLESKNDWYIFLNGLRRHTRSRGRSEVEKRFQR